MWFSTFLLLNLVRRFARSLLTALGMAIAVGTSVALLAVADSFERSSVQSFAERGVDLVVLEQGILDQLSSDLSQSITPQIAAIPGVEAVAPGLIELVDYSHSNTVLSMVLQGWEPGSFLFDDVKFVEGRPFGPDDHGVVVLGKTLAEVLNKKVGDTVDLQRKDFKVIGIFDSFNIFENGAATLPLRELQQLMARTDGITGLSVKVKRESENNEARVAEVAKQIEALVDPVGAPTGMSAVPTQEYADHSMHIQFVRAMAWATSLIALVVGTVGTLNTMLMSVLERIKEISILRAMGWRRMRVARMVMGECMLLSLIGALVGIVGAWALLTWLAQLPATRGFLTGEVHPVVIGKGLLLALAVALVGGGYPAWRATRLTPVEGLSHE
jgi:putative ABC transport system permease protein